MYFPSELVKYSVQVVIRDFVMEEHEAHVLLAGV
jgi:hypothetical protein